jgi:hypothetical protein
MRNFVVPLALVLAGTAALADADPPRPFASDHGGPYIEVTGPPEMVFDWTTDRCYDAQIPDLPVRAFRDAEEQVNLILSHTNAHAMRGPDFDSLSIDCTPLMTSSSDSDPSQFNDHEWIAAVYATEDGTVHALIHNEYQGNRYLTGCETAEYFRCWYNAITSAISTDWGRTFEHAVPPPDHLVATITEVYTPDEGIFGAFSPSNIIEREGYYYAFLKLQTYPFGDQHTCLMRTDDLSDPSSWRHWTPGGFTGQFADPFRDDLNALRISECLPISFDAVAQMYEGITWNTSLGQYILIGTSNDPQRDPNPFGFYYAISEDLTAWPRRQPLLEARLPWRATGQQTTYLYPTLIDHDSDSRNFETTGDTAYLYYTRLNFGSGNLDRDLMRVPVAIHGR